VVNSGGAELDVSLAFTSPTQGVSVALPDAGQLKLGAGEVRSLVLTAGAQGLAPGDFDGTLIFTPAGGIAPSALGAQNVSVVVRVGAADGADKAMVQLMTLGKNSKWNVVATGPALPENEYSWSIGVAPGIYFVAAGIDDNGNGKLFDPGERSGWYPTMDAPTSIKVTPGGNVDGIDFVLVPQN
jgi:hypothetical protein